MTTKLKAVAFAVGLCCAASPAFADTITCRLVNIHGGPDFQEVGFMRNGVPATYDHVPIWRSGYTNPNFRGITHWSMDAPGWAIDIPYLISNRNDAAVLRHNDRVIATGSCGWDSPPATTTVSAPEPKPVAPETAPTYDNPPSTSGDDVPFINQSGGMAVNVLVGGHAAQMILDTGASISSIPPVLADQLIAEGHATEGSGGTITLADGSSHHERSVVADAMTIGNHTRSQVPMTVSDGEPLLGLPALNAIGRFTIDAQHGVLTFGSPSTGLVASAPAPASAPASASTPAPATAAGTEPLDCNSSGAEAEYAVAKRHHLPIANGSHAEMNDWYAAHPRYDAEVAKLMDYYDHHCRPD